MSDNSSSGNDFDSDIDDVIGHIVSAAGSDAPRAPAVELFTDMDQPVADHSRSSSARPLALVGAIAVIGVAAVVSLLAIQSERAGVLDLNEDPLNTAAPNILPAPTTTDGSTATTVVPTATPTSIPTSDVGDRVEPTPLELVQVADGYVIDFAVSLPNTPESDLKVARYRNDRPDSPAIELTLRGSTRGFLPPELLAERQSWEVDGRTVVDDNQVGGCLPDYCSVNVQWDETTNVSVAWSARPGTELGPEHNIDALVEMVGWLSELGGVEMYRPTVNSLGPTISHRGVLVTGPDGVIAFDGWEPEPLVVTRTPAIKATGLPDGRVIVQTQFSAAPGELFIVDPSQPASADPVRFWPSGIPDDGSVTVDIEDAATIDGVPTLLLQVKNPNDGTIELAPVASDAGSERRVVAQFPDASLGLFPKGFVDVDLRDTDSIPAIGGVFYDAFDPLPFFAYLDGERIEVTDWLTDTLGDVRSISFSEGFLVFQDVDGPITIIDQVGDQFVEIAVQNEDLTFGVRGSLELEPALLRTFPVSGSVWVQPEPETWVEIGVDGVERNRVSGTTLTIANQ